MENKKKNIRRRGENIAISKIINKTAGSGRNRLLSVVLSFIVVAVTLLGAVFTFTTMFGVRLNTAALVAVCLALSLVFSAAFKAPKSIKFVLPVSAAALALITALFWSDIVRGINFISADVAGGLNASMQWQLPAQQWVWRADYALPTTLVMSLVAAVSAILLSAFIACRVSVIGVTLVTLPFFLSGTAFGAVPDHIAASLLISGWAACIVMRLVGMKIRGSKSGGEFVSRGGKHILAKPGDSVVSLSTGVGVMALSLAILLSLTAYTSGNSFRSGNINALRITVSEKIQQALKIVQNKDAQNGLSNGDLATVGNRVIKNKPNVKVKAPKFQEKTTYLRGFVGTLYTGNSWIDAQDYSDWADMFGKFAEAQMYPQNFSGAMLSSAAKTDGDLGSGYKNVYIAPVAGDFDKAYLFYNSYLGNDYGFERDTAVTAPGRSYQYGVFTEGVTDDKLASAPLKNDPAFSELWNRYREYVYHEYLMLPVNGLDSFKVLYKTTKKQNAYNYGKFIHDELEADKSYDNGAKRAPVGSDFAEYFMFTQKKGYCVHFATAATLMFRAAGIPARYVEGYIIPQSAYNGLTPDADGNYDITLTDAQAHAWVEVFDDELGWTVYDATPGYYDKAAYKNQVKADKKGQKGDVKKAGYNKKKKPKKNGEKKDKPGQVVDFGKIDTGNNIIDSPEYFAIRDFLRIWSAWAIAVSAMFLLAALLSVRRLASRAARRKKFAVSDKRRAVKNVYAYFSKVLFYELIENKENTPYMKFAADAAERSQHLDEQTTAAAMKIFLKSQFSESEITEDEADFVVSFAENYAKEVYGAASSVGRWIFATVRGLY